MIEFLSKFNQLFTLPKYGIKRKHDYVFNIFRGGDKNPHFDNNKSEIPTNCGDVFKSNIYLYVILKQNINLFSNK